VPCFQERSWEKWDQNLHPYQLLLSNYNADLIHLDCFMENFSHGFILMGQAFSSWRWSAWSEFSYCLQLSYQLWLWYSSLCLSFLGQIIDDRIHLSMKCEVLPWNILFQSIAEDMPQVHLSMLNVSTWLSKWCQICLGMFQQHVEGHQIKLCIDIIF
jgi:hypothetical protein